MLEHWNKLCSLTWLVGVTHMWSDEPSHTLSLIMASLSDFSNRKITEGPARVAQRQIVAVGTHHDSTTTHALRGLGCPASCSHLSIQSVGFSTSMCQVVGWNMWEQTWTVPYGASHRLLLGAGLLVMYRWSAGTYWQTGQCISCLLWFCECGCNGEEEC